MANIRCVDKVSFGVINCQTFFICGSKVTSRSRWKPLNSSRPALSIANGFNWFIDNHRVTLDLKGIDSN
jgi:hypothetical protein